MLLKPLKTSNVDEPQAARYFDKVQEYTKQLSRNEFLVGNTITTTIGITNTVISHGLDAVPNGFMILDITSNAVVWRVAWTNKTITLIASASAPIKLWVF